MVCACAQADAPVASMMATAAVILGRQFIWNLPAGDAERLSTRIGKTGRGGNSFNSGRAARDARSRCSAIGVAAVSAGRNSAARGQVRRRRRLKCDCLRNGADWCGCDPVPSPPPTMHLWDICAKTVRRRRKTAKDGGPERIRTFDLCLRRASPMD
jgi:hypothetical protein